MIKAVFFDLDGTLLDTAQDLGRALNKLRLTRGLPTLEIELIRSVVSEGALGLIKLGFEIDEYDKTYPDLREKLLDFYLRDVSSHTVPFDGIPELINTLTNNGITWGIATNKPWTYTEPLMKSFDFGERPIDIICPEHVTNKKPHPESLILACKKAKCTPSEMIYIGDHIRDIQCGVNAGTLTIAAGYGYTESRNSHLKWPANHFVNHASEIWGCVRHHL